MPDEEPLKRRKVSSSLSLRVIVHGGREKMWLEGGSTHLGLLTSGLDRRQREDREQAWGPKPQPCLYYPLSPEWLHLLKAQ